MHEKEPLPFLTVGRTEWTESHALTQAVETESTVVKEKADVARPCRHAAEGVSTARCQRINAAGKQEDHQRPGEGVLPSRLNQHHRHEFP